MNLPECRLKEVILPCHRFAQGATDWIRRKQTDMKLLAIVIAAWMLLACGGAESGSKNGAGNTAAFELPPTPGR